MEDDWKIGLFELWGADESVDLRGLAADFKLVLIEAFVWVAQNRFVRAEVLEKLDVPTVYNTG